MASNGRRGLVGSQVMLRQLCFSPRGRSRRPSFALAFFLVTLGLIVLVTGCGSPAPGPPVNGPSTASSAPGRTETPSATPSSPSPAPTPAPKPLHTPTAALPLRLKTYGDSVGGGLAWAMSEKAAAHRLVKLWVFYKPSVGLARPDYFSWPRHVAQDLAHHSYQAVVFMSGANDGQGITAGGHDLAFGTRAWLAEYRRRVGALMDLFLSHRVKRLYWVGMPHMASAAFGRLMKTINGVYRQEAAKRAPLVVYIDSWRILDAPDGSYRGGLRQPDGVHLDPSGSFRLADVVYGIVEKQWHIAAAGTVTGADGSHPDGASQTGP